MIKGFIFDKCLCNWEGMELLIKGMISKFWGRFLVIKHEMEEKYAVKSYFSENFLNLQQTNCKFEDRNEGSYTKMDNLFVRRDAFSFCRSAGCAAGGKGMVATY